jgi:GWxTD domain-containing protein
MKRAYWLLISATMAGCAVSSSVSDDSSRRPYDYEARMLHPEMSFQAFSPDSARLFMRIDREELLYTREKEGSPFIAEIRWEVAGKSWQAKDTLNAKTPREWRLEATWAINGSERDLVLRDLRRNTSTKQRVDLVRFEEGIWVMNSAGWPVASGQMHIGDTVFLSSAEPHQWTHRGLDLKPWLPAPPMTGLRDRSDTLKTSPMGVLSVLTEGPWAGWSQWIVESGIHTFSAPGFARTWVASGRGADFPEVRNLADLIESTRYITSRKEYTRMQEAADPKAALDDFWLACHSDPDRAASLISTYYGRVEEANRYFSGVQEGWRTDRGMVHIVFGLPTHLRNGNNYEHWIYGEEGSANSVTFRFSHRPTALDANRYVLQRSILYRMAWDRTITNWRNGRIQPDL